MSNKTAKIVARVVTGLLVLALLGVLGPVPTVPAL